MAGKIFCLEGEWGKKYDDKRSVLPSLQLLDSMSEIPYIHRRVATQTEFLHHLSRSSKYSSFNLLYLAFHGSSKTVWFPDDSFLTLENLADRAPKAFTQRIILFGSCKVATDKNAILEFKKVTGAKAVFGYIKNVDFFKSSLLDLACLYACANMSVPGKIYKKISEEHPFLVDHLGFSMV